MGLLQCCVFDGSTTDSFFEFFTFQSCCDRGFTAAIVGCPECCGGCDLFAGGLFVLLLRSEGSSEFLFKFDVSHSTIPSALSAASWALRIAAAFSMNWNRLVGFMSHP